MVKSFKSVGRDMTGKKKKKRPNSRIWWSESIRNHTKDLWYQAPPSMDFPGMSTGVGCHCLLQGSGIEAQENSVLQRQWEGSPWSGGSKEKEKTNALLIKHSASKSERYAQRARKGEMEFLEENKIAHLLSLINIEMKPLRGRRRLWPGEERGWGEAS